MGENIELHTADGATIGAYRARPDGPAKGGIVLLQEIFGVTAHIRAVADRFAAAGYLVVAPALFDRVEPGVELPYGPTSIPKARELRGALSLEGTLADIAAAAQAAAEGGKVGIVGFCWGGLLAYLAAARLPGISAAVGYYAGEIGAHLEPQLGAPVMLHFGEEDHLIPLDDVERARAAHPDAAIHLYPAGHGFNCDERPSFHEPSAQLAWQRTLAFLEAQLA